MKSISRFAGFWLFLSIALACSLPVSAAEDGTPKPESFADFEKSAAPGAKVPAGLSDPLKSLWLSRAGQWDAAHEIAQELKTTTGSWIHGFLHREEGDRSNAGYWYRQAGMTLPAEGFPIADEWSLIARELWQREFGLIAGEETLTSPTGLVATTVPGADGEEGSWDTLIRKDGKEVTRIANARPVSFSPGGDVLLLIEAAADDDCQHFLIKPSADVKVPAFGQRKRIGGRAVTGHKWSEDGKELTLTSEGGAKPASIKVAEQLTAK